jgi:hypothetical protein
MARLTIASLTSDLAAQGISLTKTSKGYTVVMTNGYSFTEPTLAKVVIAIDEADVKTGCLGNTCPATLPEFDAEEEVDNINGTELEIMSVQSTRVNQLASLFPDNDWLHSAVKVDSTLAEDEEVLGAELVRQADERREQKELQQIDEELGKSFVYRSLEQAYPSKQNHSNKFITGFGTNSGNTARVSAKLQRKANRFHSLLATAA